MKKLFLMFVCISLVLGSLPAFAASDNISEIEYTSRLEGLGITGIYDEELSLDKPVRRSEFAVLITKLLGRTTKEDPSDSVYKDVSKDHAYAGEIKLVKELGFFDGYSDGKFYPDEYVTLYEVKECLGKILGYNHLPEEYAEQKMSEEIVKDITTDKYPSREAILKILDNCLEAKIVKVQFSGEATTIGDSEETFLSEYRDIYIARGIVTGNGVTTLTEEKLTEGRFIEIDGIKFSISDSVVSDYLGMRVEYYYTDIDGEYTVQFMTPVNNNVLNLTGEYIVDYDEGNAELRSYKYYDYNYRVKRAELSENLYVIINGIAEPEYSIKDTRPETGDVTLIDNNDDNVYDVLIVFNASEEYCVSEIAYENDGYIILDMIDKSRTCKLEAEGDNEYYTIYKNGVKLPASALKAGDSILIGTSSSKTGYKIIKASEEKISGKVKGMSGDSIVIDGTEYEMTAKYREASANGKIPPVQLGKTVIAYLNVYGKIQYVEYGGETDFQYGIYIESYEDTDEENRYYIKVFNTDGEFVKYILDETVILGYDDSPNGKKKDVKEAIAIIERENAYDGGRKNNAAENPLRQLIEFRVNGKGIISAINIVSGALDPDPTKYDSKYPLNYGGVVEMYDDYTYYPYALQSVGSMTMGSKFIATGNTYFFDIYADEDDFVCRKGSVSGDDEANLYVYDVDEKLTAGVVIRYFEKSDSAHEFNESANYPFIVTSIGKGLNEDDEVVDYITGMENGEEKTIYYDLNDYEKFKEDFSDGKDSDPGSIYELGSIPNILEDVERGDMLLYNLSNAGKVIGISRKFQADKIGQYGGTSFSYSSTPVHEETNERYIFGQHTQRKMYYGKVVKNIGGFVIINLGEANKNVVVNLTGFTDYVTVVEKTGNKVYVDKTKLVSDIKPGDEIVTCCKYNNKNDSVFILKYSN